MCYATEKELIQAMVEAMYFQNDADCIITFNGIRFDTPYLLERAKLLGIVAAWYSSRFLNAPIAPPEERNASSKQAGINRGKMAKTPGRIQFDVMLGCKQITTRKFGSLSLKNLAIDILQDEKVKEAKKDADRVHDRVAEFSAEEILKRRRAHGDDNSNLPELLLLAEDEVEKMVRKYPVESFNIDLNAGGQDVTSKMEFPYELILPFSVADAKHRAVLGAYNLTDVDTTWLIHEKQNFSSEYNAMSNLTRVGITELLTSGQGVKSVSLIFKECERNGWIVNEKGLDDCREMIGEDYEGGHVEKAKAGYYDEDVVVLDFQSLYPSLMIGNRLCYSTFVKIRKWDPYKKKYVPDPTWLKFIDEHKIPVKEVEVGHDTFTFVQTKLEDSVLPQILTTLLAARKKARAEQALCEKTDRNRWLVLEGRQLAMKLVANSLYGFTGAKAGALPYPPIARSVTSIGREMFARTQQLAESPKYRARLIYGDTDSVFLIFPPQLNDHDEIEMDREKQRKLQWKIGMELAAEASGDNPDIPAIFPKPCRLELEKIMCPLLLLGPKKYAYVYNMFFFLFCMLLKCLCMCI